MKKRLVAIWLRVSSEDQKLDSQRDAVKRYVQARGWKVTARFIEEGVCGRCSTSYDETGAVVLDPDAQVRETSIRPVNHVRALEPKVV